MAIAFWVLVALIGVAIHLWRHKDERGTAAVSRVLLMYWLGIAIGIGSIFGAAFHVFDAKEIAEQIGFDKGWSPEGAGAFQFENAMGDLAIGAAALLCFWIRDPKFWLAVIIIATIQFWGDAYGHIHQMIEYDNHEPDNTGAILWLDILNPVILIVLYFLAFRHSRDGQGTSPSG